MTDVAGSKFEKPENEVQLVNTFYNYKKIFFFQKLKLSECTPLFMNAYNIRNAGAVMHR